MHENKGGLEFHAYNCMMANSPRLLELYEFFFIYYK